MRIIVRISCVFIIIITSLLVNTIQAQEKVVQRKTLKEKLFFGGSIGMVFGTVTRVDILPQAGMWVIPQWAIGVGGRYSYRRERFNIFGGQTNPYKTHIWGLSGFTQILPIPDFDKVFKNGIRGGIVFQGEWEGLYLDKGTIDPLAANPEGKGWVHLFLAGVGYRVPIGERAALNILVLWDLTNNRYSPYTTNPLLRVNINF
ncbi:MAG: hypothetical protein AB9846_12225 [Tenuifilaceae bacterium]